MTTAEPLTLFTRLTGNLTSRNQIVVRGEDAETLLQSIITADLSTLQPGVLRAAALLSPQGKIQFDFLISRTDSNGDNGFRIDIDQASSEAFVKRLTLYRLRAKAEIIVLNESVIRISWQTESNSSENDSISTTDYATLRDERFPEHTNVQRHYAQGHQQSLSVKEASVEDLSQWAHLRIVHGVSEGGADYPMNDVFPHDINLEQLSGVSFKKGCFIGQEVVSRMQHRGTARRRVLIAKGAASLPKTETMITANGKDLGSLRSVAGQDGLALVRLDRVKAALDQQIPLMAGDVQISLSIPDYATFTYPVTEGE